MSFSETVNREVWSLLLGRELGEGQGRKVYVYLPDPTLVIKVEDRSRSFQNVAEWQVWEAAKGTPWAKHFAPCVSISQSGSVLLMKRTDLMRAAEYPKRVPSFFADLKYANYGRLNGRLVAHDYGTFPLVMLNNALSNRMRRANWWGEKP